MESTASKAVTCVMFFFVLLSATGARAQNPSGPAAPTIAPPPPLPLPPAGIPAPAPYTPSTAYPPPGANPYAYGASYGNPYGGSYGLNPQTMFVYEDGKKNPGVAVLLSLLFPGIGNIYADHAVGAVITWVLILGGASFMLWGLQHEVYQGDGRIDLTPALVGCLVMVGGVVYSPIDAYLSANDYNRALRQRLGLPEGLSLGPAPIRMGQTTAYGAMLSLRF